MLKKYFFSLAFLVLLAGCGGQPYDYQDPNEIKPGGGLLSGEQGEFYLIKAKKDAEEADADSPESEDKKE